MATEKTVNYTEEMTKELVAAYVAAPTEDTVKAFAEKFGRTARSIVAKLARENVYKAKAKETAGKREMLKSEMVDKIAEALGEPAEKLESLEKATAPALTALVAGVAALVTPTSQ